MFAVLGDLFTAALYAGFAYLAYVVLIRGTASPSRRWISVIVLAVLAYPWTLASSALTTDIMNRWLSTGPVHPLAVIRELQPILTVWHDAPLIVALAMGFRLLRRLSLT